jgi:predicted cupin superfamily sugar epimerase
MSISVQEIISKFNLKPLPGEGGYFSETYKSQSYFGNKVLPDNYRGNRAFSTCIYYLITADSFSRLHRLPTDEIWHFYLGDSAKQLQLYPDGKGKLITIGNNIEEGELPQVISPANVWQGTRLKAGGDFALFGTTMSPGFEFSDYEGGDTEELVHEYPKFTNEILRME